MHHPKSIAAWFLTDMHTIILSHAKAFKKNKNKQQTTKTKNNLKNRNLIVNKYSK